MAELTHVTPEPDGDTFADTGNYWGKGQINALKRRGILSESNNLFRPNEVIRKDDLMVILERLLVLPNTIDFHSNSYKDVPLTSSAYNAISKLSYFDIAKGQNKNFFRPEDSITVEDMAKILDSISMCRYYMNPDRLMPSTNPHRLSPVRPNKDTPILEPR